MFYAHEFSVNKTFGNSSKLASINFAQAQSPTNTTASENKNTSLTQTEAAISSNWKSSKTLKTTFFGFQPNEILVRVANLDDHFDGPLSSRV